MNSAIITIIRTVFSLASRIAPKVTGRAAFRLFCTPLPVSNNSSKHQERMATARALFSEAKAHTIDYSGGSVMAFEFEAVITSGSQSTDFKTENDLKTVWLLHGWQSQSLLMAQFIEPLLNCGFRVISVDLPGHGQSSGRTFHLPLAVSAMHAVSDRLGAADMILSHSLGGAVTATTLAGTLPNYPALPIEKLVLISSPHSMTKIFNDFADMIGLSKVSRQELHAMVTRLSGRLTEDFNTGTQLQALTNEVLLIHAPDDKEVPFSETEAIAELIPGAVVKAMPGLGHRRIIASEAVVKLAVEFLRKPVESKT